MMNIKNTLIAGSLCIALLASGCSVQQTEEAKLPDAKISVDAGKLPDYDIKKTEDGQMPDVDAEVKGGNLPKYDVDVADVDVKTEKTTVKVPKVVTEETQVDLPDVDVTMPKDK